MRQLDLRRIKFLSFKLFKSFENFKTTFRSYYLTVASLFYFKPVFSSCTRVWKYRRETRPKKHSGTSLFFIKNLRKCLYTWRMTSLLFPVNSVLLQSLKKHEQISFSKVCDSNQVFLKIYKASEVPDQKVLFQKICKFFKNTFFHRTPLVAASVVFK